MKTVSVKDLVKDNSAEFVFFCDGCLFYDIRTPSNKVIARFTVDITNKDEIGLASFAVKEKAITLMRYIRKAIAEDTITYF